MPRSRPAPVSATVATRRAGGRHRREEEEEHRGFERCHGATVEWGGFRGHLQQPHETGLRPNREAAGRRPSCRPSRRSGRPNLSEWTDPLQRIIARPRGSTSEPGPARRCRTPATIATGRQTRSRLPGCRTPVRRPGRAPSRECCLRRYGTGSDSRIPVKGSPRPCRSWSDPHIRGRYALRKPVNAAAASAGNTRRRIRIHLAIGRPEDEGIAVWPAGEDLAAIAWSPEIHIVVGPAEHDVAVRRTAWRRPSVGSAQDDVLTLPPSMTSLPFSRTTHRCPARP